jgi:hypothetical protein
MLRRLSILMSLVAWAAAAGVAAYVAWLRPMMRTWGVDPEERDLPLPGDDVVPAPTITETRGITIDATPAAVWPWLVQLGYGRAGWYSYDKLDVRVASADRILTGIPELKVGDTLPAWPGGGFRIEAVEPEKALVLYLDSEIAKAQAGSAAKAGRGDGGTRGDEQTPGGLKVAGGVGGTAMPEFKASWSFVLRPKEAGRTRLIERFRVWAPTPTPGQRMALPIMGLGVFLMTRKQMLGIKERVERTSGAPATGAPAKAEPEPTTEEGGSEVPVGAEA